MAVGRGEIWQVPRHAEYCDEERLKLLPEDEFYQQRTTAALQSAPRQPVGDQLGPSCAVTGVPAEDAAV